MHGPVRCFSCGGPVGQVVTVFAHARQKRIREVLKSRDTAPSQATIDTDLQVACGDILDRLGILDDCCRTSLFTTMVFQEYYQ